MFLYNILIVTMMTEVAENQRMRHWYKHFTELQQYAYAFTYTGWFSVLYVYRRVFYEICSNKFICLFLPSNLYMWGSMNSYRVSTNML